MSPESPIKENVMEDYQLAEFQTPSFVIGRTKILTEGFKICVAKPFKSEKGIFSKESYPLTSLPSPRDYPG
jgi:hypothetical protein